MSASEGRRELRRLRLSAIELLLILRPCGRPSVSERERAPRSAQLERKHALFGGALLALLADRAGAKVCGDGAEPAAVSVASVALLKLGVITEQKQFTEAAENTLKLYAERMADKPYALPHMLAALDFWLHKPYRAVVAGKPDDPQTAKLAASVHRVFQPNKVVLGNVGSVEPFAKNLKKNRLSKVRRPGHTGEHIPLQLLHRQNCIAAHRQGAFQWPPPRSLFRSRA